MQECFVCRGFPLKFFSSKKNLMGARHPHLLSFRRYVKTRTIASSYIIRIARIQIIFVSAGK